jgi:hypothetical protein
MPSSKRLLFRLLLNLTFCLFKRKSLVIQSQVEWQDVPHEWSVDYVTKKGDGPLKRTTILGAPRGRKSTKVL